MTRAGAIGVVGEYSTHATGRTDHRVGAGSELAGKSQKNAIPRHRTDIDGLRAVAVLAVLMAHSALPGFIGGFLGVDIFFVISGYLIHQDLSQRLSDGRFSLLGFYGRRLRRTVPALYLVAGATLVAATCVMVPGDLDEAAQSLLRTIAFVPNIYFWHLTGYFEAKAITKPLLHTWSLGVEAQFYVLAPLLAFGLHYLGRTSRHVALAVLFALGLVVATALHQISWSTGFYLTPARLFEFLIGIALAENIVPAVERRWVAETVTASALLVIGLCVAFFVQRVPHPGLPTLVPCLAAAAIIHVGRTRETVAGRLLSLRPIVFIGVISYSIYLWHWPVLVLSQAAGIAETPLVLTIQAGLVFGVSVLSWRFVEVPFRTAGSPWRRRLPWLVPVGAASLAAAALLLVRLDGLPQRFPPEVAAVASYYNRTYEASFRQGQCFITSKNTLADFDSAACLRLERTKPNVLLLGDSHAAQLYTALRDVWPRLNVLQATASGCKPSPEASDATPCATLMADMIARFVPRHRLDAVVIAGLWETDDVEQLKRTVAALGPFTNRVIVVGPLPRYDVPLATLLARGMMQGRLEDVSTHHYSWTEPLDRRMKGEFEQMAARLPVVYVSAWQTLCGSGDCRLFASPGVPLQFDYHHLTPAGANALMAEIAARRPALFGPPGDGTSRKVSASMAP